MLGCKRVCRRALLCPAGHHTGDSDLTHHYATLGCPPRDGESRQLTHWLLPAYLDPEGTHIICTRVLLAAEGLGHVFFPGAQEREEVQV